MDFGTVWPVFVWLFGMLLAATAYVLATRNQTRDNAKALEVLQKEFQTALGHIVERFDQALDRLEEKKVDRVTCVQSHGTVVNEETCTRLHAVSQGTAQKALEVAKQALGYSKQTEANVRWLLTEGLQVGNPKPISLSGAPPYPEPPDEEDPHADGVP